MNNQRNEEDNKQSINDNQFIGIIWICWFAVVGLLTYAVPCGRYHTAKRPSIGEVVPPSGKFDAMHWLCMIAGILIGVGVMLIPEDWFSDEGTQEEIEARQSRCRMSKCLFIGCSLLWIVFYIVYVILFFISEEFKTKYETISFDDFQKLTESWMTAPPEFWIYGRATSLKSSSTTNPICTTKDPIVVRSHEWTDESEPLTLTREQLGDFAIRVKSTVSVETDSDGKKVLDSMKQQVVRCLERGEQSQWLEDVTTVVEGGLKGFKPYLLVTKDGKTPGSLKKGAAGTGGFFAAGVVYMYDLARKSPVITYNMKKHANISEGPVDCSVVGWCWDNY